MHFNDLEMRVRNFYITVMTAIFGAAGFSLTDDYFLEAPFGFRVTIAFPLFLLGWMAAYLFYIMDRHWYHRLLVGAVRAADEIASEGYFVGKHLGTKIREGSPISFGDNIWEKALLKTGVVGESGVKELPDGGLHLHSDGKLQIFYKLPIYLCVMFALFCLVFGMQVSGDEGYRSVWVGFAEFLSRINPH